MATIDEKRKTLENGKSEIKSAMVVANYGDPGLQESSNWDVLSRFVICKILSTDRVLTADKWAEMIVAVKRPESIWINPVNGLQSDQTQQQRSDYFGNISIGIPTNYSVNGISPISNTYNLGDIIHIKKSSLPLNANNSPISTFFQSIYSNLSQSNYGAWYNAGLTLPYIQNNNAQNNLTLKTLDTIPNNAGYFMPSINKYQYEAFMLTINNGNSDVTSALTQIFQGTWNGATQIYNAHGGYIFNETQSLDICNIQYEDIDDRTRLSENSCLPLVVAVPSSFPTPSSRSPGLISYNPIVQQVNQ
jgi:hypothetical protein